VASNRLVVLTPSDQQPPSTVTELAEVSFDRVAVANPKTAPVGRYTRQSLVALDLEPALRERLVLAESARQILDYVERGEVAAGISYRTDAMLFRDRLNVGPMIPADSHDRIVYQAAVLADSPHAESARRFLDVLRSDSGRAVLERHGFLPPPGP
jgi:molybdate transport system substrate-binding protein